MKSDGDLYVGAGGGDSHTRAAEHALLLSLMRTEIHEAVILLAAGETEKGCLARDSEGPAEPVPGKGAARRLSGLPQDA